MRRHFVWLVTLMLAVAGAEHTATNRLFGPRYEKCRRGHRFERRPTARTGARAACGVVAVSVARRDLEPGRGGGPERCAAVGLRSALDNVFAQRRPATMELARQAQSEPARQRGDERG